MLITLVPLFNKDLTVQAYSVFSQKNNQFLNPLSMMTSSNDGATSVPGLDILQTMGIETISGDTQIFVPLTNISIFSDLEGQSKGMPHSRIVFLLDNTIPPVEMYVDRIKELKEKGFGFAIRKLGVSEFMDYSSILAEMDYIFLNSKRIVVEKAKAFFSQVFPKIKLVAGNIETQDTFSVLKNSGGYDLFEGKFYRVPMTRGSHDVAPVKLTYLSLLKVVNAPDFDLQEAAEVISRDTALTISLLKMVNRIVKTAEITTIRHAAAMLGQKELKKWINTAVTEELYADKPSEVTRLSLLRARFAENLAGQFDLQLKSEELFLMGLFSVLDVILEKPMSEALAMIQVSKDIKDALVFHEGPLAPVLDFLLLYESADWAEISRLLVLKEMDMEQVYESYKETLTWYRTTIIG